MKFIVLQGSLSNGYIALGIYNSAKAARNYAEKQEDRVVIPLYQAEQENIDAISE